MLMGCFLCFEYFPLCLAFKAIFALFGDVHHLEHFLGLSIATLMEVSMGMVQSPQRLDSLVAAPSEGLYGMTPSSQGLDTLMAALCDDLYLS